MLWPVTAQACSLCELAGLKPAKRRTPRSRSPSVQNGAVFPCSPMLTNGEELFGYYECEKGVSFAQRVQAESPVVDRWNIFMQDILELEMDPETGAQPMLEPVFRLD